MYFYRSLRLTGLIALSLLWSKSYAADCSFLKLDPLVLKDRQLFYLVKGGSDWTLLEGPAPNLTDLDVEYAYVVRESRDYERSGVVVLKSARVRGMDEPRDIKPVRLVRNQDYANNRTCGRISAFGEQDVSSKSYDDFHDLGRSVPEQEVLNNFHIKYAARLNHCRRTNDNWPDSPKDARSNRGQFSFNDEVVSQQTYNTVLNLAGITTALAASGYLDDQRVEIKQYQVGVNTPTCVRFTLPRQRPNSFLKINDLEGLTQVDQTSKWIRSEQKGWVLSR